MEKAKSLDWVKSNIEKRNLAKDMDESDLNKIGERCMRGYDLDLESRSEWEKTTEEGLKIARQIRERKTYPWPNASSVKYPLIATAAIQFASRAYPQIIQGADVVKAKVIGKVTDEKEERARRVGAHMSYQLTEQMEEWETDTDQLLTSLPVVGMYFRKTYFDPLYGRNRSISVSPLDLVINQKAKSLETARRVSEKVMLYKNDVLERENSGIFVEGVTEVMETNTEEDKDELFIEQHTWLDLDGDDYMEPYIVTIHKDSEMVCRLVARYDEDGIKINKKGKIVRIEAVHYYTDFGFLPDPGGGYYKMGFAHLLGPINESISTAINQLLDAGHLANVQGGLLGNGVRIQGGVLRIRPGEFLTVETTGGSLKDNIFPYPIKEPSAVLFQLLGLLTETGMKLAAVSETMTGEMPGQNTPATTVLAMIEQGLKVFTSIYKRVFRSLKSEYKKLYRLNRLYMDEEEYITVLDDRMAVFQTDYNLKDLDIVPVADPSVSSEAQRLARAQAVINTFQMNPTVKGKVAILDYYYRAVGVPDVNKFLPQDELNQPPSPDPKAIEAQIKALESKVKMTIDQQRANTEQIEAESRIGEIEAHSELMKAQAVKAIADAEAVEVGQQFEQYQLKLDALSHDLEVWKEQNQAKLAATNPEGEGDQGGPDTGDTGNDVGGGIPGMEGAPNNDQGAALSSANAGGIPETPLPGGNTEQELGNANSLNDFRTVGQNLRNRAAAGSEGGIPGRQAGGPVSAGQPYVVGEGGPEVMVPQDGGTVVPNHLLRNSFDPEGAGYDYESAISGGITPDKTGHWASRNPITGQLLKGIKHPTFYLTIQGEKEAGYEIYKGTDGKYYSRKIGKENPEEEGK